MIIVNKSQVRGSKWELAASVAYVAAGLVVSGQSSYEVLGAFDGSQGSVPRGGLTVTDGVIYGTTSQPPGTIFRIGTNGAGFQALASFGVGNNYESSYAGLAVSGGIFYGSTYSQRGIFSIREDGGNFTTQPSHRNLKKALA